METFAYAHPATKQEVFGLLGNSWTDAAVLAGGTDIISLMKEHVVIPQRVVSIRGIKEWGGISKTPAGLRIGALVTFEELRENALIRADYRSLQNAVDGIGSPQMRNMGTVGGDLCQRPRCWYFRNGFGLLARDAKGNSLVPNGENRYHAIFGNDGPAYFVNASSLAPALVALGATLHIEGAGGGRDVSAADFFVIPKNDSDREIVLKPNEVVTEILIPASAAGMKNHTYEVRQRQLLDWPLATASVALKMNGGTVSSAKIVLGHVAPIPWQADNAAKSLVGKRITEETATAAGDTAVQGAKPLSQNSYKVQLAKVSVKRALLAAAKGRSLNMLKTTSLKQLIQTGEVCKCLRAKTLFYDTGELEGSQENNPHHYAMYSGMNGPFWCVQTQGLQGPDGKIASIENCHGKSGRSCCETA